jgi:tight adherence protein B
MLGILFYNHILAATVCSVLSLFAKKNLQRYCQSIKNQSIEKEFKLFIQGVSSAMSAGHSLENSVKESCQTLLEENPKLILRDNFKRLNAQLDTNQSITESFYALSDKFPLESILNFTSVIEITILHGGSIQKVIDTTATMIDDQHGVLEELQVIITQKKFELYMLLAFVPGMILYMKGLSNQFAEAMYGTIQGRIIMTLALSLYLLSWFVGRKVVDIKV